MNRNEDMIIFRSSADLTRTERVSIGATALLTMSVILLMVADMV